MTTESAGAATPRLFIPPLRTFYEWSVPFSYALIRVVAGLMILPHGIPKLMRGMDPVIGFFDHRGLQPAWLVAGLILFNETLGGLFVAVGFLTRLCAASIAVEMAVITWGFVPEGYGRLEYTLMWGLIMFAIALGGGGAYSIDRKLGWEI
jgi:putative oxidoreductase